MSKPKTQNSILVLATLGVYLGLVLVGATPQVLAQAAMTRQFSVKDEIEVKDDLDKKPLSDDLSDASTSIETYFSDVDAFIQDLGRLYRAKKFDPTADSFAVNDSGIVPCKIDGDPVNRSERASNVGNHWLEPAISDALYASEHWIYLADCLPVSDLKNYSKETLKNIKNASSVGLGLSYDSVQFEYHVSVKKSSSQSAQRFVDTFQRAFVALKVDKESIPSKALYDTTSISYDNDQVFIVTRLPRAGLDSLLAIDAK